MYTFLGMSYWLISWTDFVTHLVGLTAAPTWGMLADRWGTKRMLTVALTAKAIFPFLWLAILPQWWYLVFAVVAVRVFNTAQEIGFVNLGLRLAPEADRAAYISVYRGCNNLARAIAPALAGVLAALIGDRVWQAGPIPVTALHVLIIISGVLRLGSLLWLRKIREPNHVVLTEVAEDEDLHHD
jgi:MFS family permease